MARTCTFVFNPKPEGGYTVTCPALPGLGTYGESLDEARQMARDAMEGLIEVMIENGEQVPESNATEANAALQASLTRTGRQRVAIRSPRWPLRTVFGLLVLPKLPQGRTTL